jgi:haloalkane dehalogenase
VTSSPQIEPWRVEYPFASHWLGLSGQRMHYVDEGRGKPILFVHGNPTWSFAWRRFIAGLSPRYRCVAVDHVGCGLSDKPREYNYTLRQHIENLDRLITALDLKEITLVAHDWGGAIGLGAALRQPGRFSRYVLCNTAAFRSNRIPFRIAICRWPVFGAIAVRGFNGFSRAALTMAVEHRERMTPVVQAGYLAPYNSWANRVAVHRFVQDIPMHVRHPSHDTLAAVESGLETLKAAKTLLLWGEKDWCFTPWFRDEFRRRWPAAEVESYPDAGHYVFEDAHERMLPRLRAFIQS